MAGPEQLHDDGVRLGRRRSFVVLGLVLVLLAGLGALRLSRSTPDPSPAPSETPVAASSSARQPWPDDLPPGTLFAASGGLVDMIDTGSGAVTPTNVQAAPTTSMTHLSDGVLVWRKAGTGGRALLFDSAAPYPVLGVLRSATAFLPGPDDLVWAEQGRGADRAVWRLVDVDGRVARSVSVVGPVVGDGRGGLLSAGRQGVRPLAVRPRPAPQPGEVVATGPDGYVVRSCVQPDCRFTLHSHTDDRDTQLQTAVGADTSGGTLSPRNRLLAVTETVGGTSTLRVSVVATGEVKFIFPTPKESTNDAVWLDDRWLALISEDHLTLYDADDDRVATPDLPLSGIGPLAWRPAP